MKRIFHSIYLKLSAHDSPAIGNAPSKSSGNVRLAVKSGVGSMPDAIGLGVEKCVFAVQSRKNRAILPRWKNAEYTVRDEDFPTKAVKRALSV
jgi:hypothetical protein